MVPGQPSPSPKNLRPFILLPSWRLSSEFDSLEQNESLRGESERSFHLKWPLEFLLSTSTSTSSVFPPPLLSCLLLHPCLSCHLLFFSFGRISTLFLFDTSLFFFLLLFFSFAFFSFPRRSDNREHHGQQWRRPRQCLHRILWRRWRLLWRRHAQGQGQWGKRKKKKKKKWPLELFFLFCLSFSFSFGLRFIVRSINCEICQGDRFLPILSGSVSCIWVTTKVILTLKGR